MPCDPDYRGATGYPQFYFQTQGSLRRWTESPFLRAHQTGCKQAREPVVWDGSLRLDLSEVMDEMRALSLKDFAHLK